MGGGGLQSITTNNNEGGHSGNTQTHTRAHTHTHTPVGGVKPPALTDIIIITAQDEPLTVRHKNSENLTCLCFA